MRKLLSEMAIVSAFYSATFGHDKQERILGHYDPEKKLNINRNDLCHCGSGVKYKKCCLYKK